MKCSACGEENAQNARFCSFCGARLNAASPDEEEKKEEARADEEAEQATPEAQTAPEAANEQPGSGLGFAIAMGVGGLAVVGVGAWYAWKASQSGGKRKKHRKRARR